MSAADEYQPWQELRDAMGDPSPQAQDAYAVAMHVIESECLAHTHRLLAVLKLLRLGVVTLEQVIELAEAHLEDALDEGE